MHLSRLFVLAFALLVTACATKFDPQEAGHIQTIAIVEPQDPLKYPVEKYVQENMASNYTPANDDKDVALTDLLKKRQNVRYGAELTAAIGQALQGAGYRIVAVQEDSPPPAEADALLELDIEYAGYIDTLISPYVPRVLVRVSLTDIKRDKTLFNALYNYSTFMEWIHETRFKPAAMYQFDKFDQLIAQGPLAAEGLRAALPLIASSMAQSLKRPAP